MSIDKTTTKQTAEKLFASTTHDVLWANPKGEFFTSENIGRLSLKADEKLTKFYRKALKPLKDESTQAGANGNEDTDTQNKI